jgi:hypothetical protein
MAFRDPSFSLFFCARAGGTFSFFLQATKSHFNGARSLFFFFADDDG